MIYLGQHIRAKHSDVQKQVCEVCLLEVNVNMQKHRKSCIKCRFCDYENHKKARLLNHIDKCEKRTLDLQDSMQEKPLDLRSPCKKKKSCQDVEDANLEDGASQSDDEVPMVEVEKSIKMKEEDQSKVSKSYSFKSKCKREDLEKGRLCFPFDDKTAEED